MCSILIPWQKLYKFKKHNNHGAKGPFFSLILMQTKLHFFQMTILKTNHNSNNCVIYKIFAHGQQSFKKALKNLNIKRFDYLFVIGYLDKMMR